MLLIPVAFSGMSPNGAQAFVPIKAIAQAYHAHPSEWRFRDPPAASPPLNRA
jgi:hypothetical protein